MSDHATSNFSICRADRRHKLRYRAALTERYCRTQNPGLNAKWLANQFRSASQFEGEVETELIRELAAATEDRACEQTRTNQKE